MCVSLHLWVPDLLWLQYINRFAAWRKESFSVNCCLYMKSDRSSRSVITKLFQTSEAYLWPQWRVSPFKGTQLTRGVAVICSNPLESTRQGSSAMCLLPAFELLISHVKLTENWVIVCIISVSQKHVVSRAIFTSNYMSEHDGVQLRGVGFAKRRKQEADNWP